jgi:CPA1 family monovalent cation:H+ antiporter
MSANTRLAVVSFWEYVSFFLGSIVFLMIGLEVNLPLLLEHGFIIVLAFGAVLASRAVSVFLPLPIFFRLNQPIDLKSATVVWWAGLRGSLSMVLALSLPESLAVRDVLIAMTFGVVVLSVVVQGSTMGMLLKYLGFVKIRTKAASLLGKNLAKLKMVQAQIQEIETFPSAELPFAKEISKRLAEERTEIISRIESQKNDQDFIKATEERVGEIEARLQQIARDALRRCNESNLVTEQEANEIAKERGEKID